MGAFNSKEFEFADIKVNVFGTELSGLRGLTFKKSQEKEVVYGAGNQPKAIQRGNKKYEGTLTVLKSDFDALEKAAIAAGYEDVIDLPSDAVSIVCVHQKAGSLDINTVTCFGVEFTESEDGMKQGDKFKEIALPFIFLRKVTA